MRNVCLILIAVLMLSANLHGESVILSTEPRPVPEYQWGPKEIFAWVAVPAEVTVGDTLTATIRIDNRQSAGRFVVDDVRFEGSYFAGFELLSILPMAVEMDTSSGDLDLVYGVSISAGHSEEFEVELRAKRPGVYIGSVDIYPGLDEDDYIERTAQTEVRPAS